MGKLPRRCAAGVAKSLRVLAAVVRMVSVMKLCRLVGFMGSLCRCLSLDLHPTRLASPPAPYPTEIALLNGVPEIVWPADL